MSSTKVSVIIPVYNTAQYLPECLDSIVNQTYPKEFIEVIIIDDASNDDSYSVAQGYKKKYPDLIWLYKNKSNKGAGYSRNRGLEYAKGTYVMFVDSDDFIDNNVLQTGINIMENESLDQLVYSYRYYSKTNIALKRNPSSKLFSMNRALFNYEFAAFPEILHALGVSNKIFRKSFIGETRFPRKKFEDAFFSIESFVKTKKIYFTDRITYHYRKRDNRFNPSAQDQMYEQVSGYYDHLDLNKYIDSLKNSNPHLAFSIDWINIKTWFPFAHEMFRNKNAPLNKLDKSILFHKAKSIFNKIEIDNYYNKSVDPRANYMLKAFKSSNYTTAKIKYRSMLAIDRLTKLIKKNLVHIKIRPSAQFFKKIHKFTILKEIIICWVEKASLYFQSSKILRQNNGELWLFCERGDEARDNAYHLFRHIRQTRPEIPAYYLISSDAPQNDLRRILSLGNIINYGTKEHKKYFIAATHLISTNARGYIEPWRLSVTKRVFKKTYPSKKFIFLQHGISANDQTEILGKNSDSGSFNLFISGAKGEFDMINESYGYKSNEVRFCGFPRFDALVKRNSSTLKTILFMPTWRSYLVQSSWMSKTVGRSIKDEVFLKSNYYLEIQRFINSKDLELLLNKHRIKLLFYPHYETKEYLKYFTKSSTRVDIINSNSHDLQELLIQSDLLVTDYSSVLFDFALMNKPAIYYHFDGNDFFTRHYKKGSFDLEKNGFGPVVKDLEHLISVVKDAVETKSKNLLKSEYTDRSNRFFQIDLSGNCQRTLEAIINNTNDR